MNLETLESRTLLAGDMEAQEPEMDAFRLFVGTAAFTVNAVISPFTLAYDVGAEAANVATGLTELVIDAATCKLNPSEENCTPHRDLNEDVVKMIGGTTSMLATTYLAAKQLQAMGGSKAALLTGAMITLSQAIDIYGFNHGRKVSLERLAVSLNLIEPRTSPPKNA